MRRHGIGASLACALVACAGRPRPPPPVDVPLSVPAIAPPPASSRAARVEPPPDVPDAYSWTDERVVDRLAVDCRWRSLAADRGRPYGRHPLSCVLDDRSGNGPINTCFDELEAECKPACTRTCHGCAGACVATCETCKGACADDDCRRSCADECARCRQECVRDVDMCQATVCATRYRECFMTMTTDLKRPACKAACAAAYRCARTCEHATGSDACFASCRSTFAAKCDDRYFAHCAESGS